ncbi:hypothetical protein KA005_71010, partial [bacterium]|nr:hypothetical protein [bacterium]
MAFKIPKDTKDLLVKIDITSKRGLRFFTAVVILVPAILFIHLFVVPLSEEYLRSSWIVYLLGYIILTLLEFIIFSSDTLYERHDRISRYAKAFQLHWPSNYVAEKFKVPQKKADYCWFQHVFNHWQDSSHPMNQQHKRTLRRGYSCRFVYYFVKFLEFLMAISVVAFIAWRVLEKLYPQHIKIEQNIFWQVTFIMVIAVLYIIMRRGHSVNLSRLKG